MDSDRNLGERAGQHDLLVLIVLDAHTRFCAGLRERLPGASQHRGENIAGPHTGESSNKQRVDAVRQSQNRH